jgi:hypothetical protein
MHVPLNDLYYLFVYFVGHFNLVPHCCDVLLGS